MKLLIAFLLCALVQTYCVPVPDESTAIKKMYEIIRDTSNDCIRELNLDPRFINDQGPPTDRCIIENPKMAVCITKKMGLMNQEGIDNLDRSLSISETAEKRQQVLDKFNDKKNECVPLAGDDPCKMVSCLYGFPISFCERAPNKDDGC